MKKLIAVMLLLLMITPCLRAQRKEMSQARSYLKSGKDLNKAEKLMTDLLEDSVNRRNPKIYLLWYEAVEKQYEAGNEKLYLNEKYDTASLFTLTKRMFTILETLDSIDAQPNKKGEVKPKYRKKHAAAMNRLRPNLYSGGSYFVRKANFPVAYSFYDAYIDCARQPLFSDYSYAANDKRMAEAAYWATYCGFKMGNADLTLKYAEAALEDTVKESFTLQYIVEAYKSQKNDSAYFAYLSRGFEHFPKDYYFFPRLMDYYMSRNSLDSALQLSERGLGIDSMNVLFLYAKSNVLLNLGRYEECIEISEKLISVNDSLADAYFNAGTAYLNQTLAMESKKHLRQHRNQLLTLYRKALPYMEKYRLLAADEKQKWAPALYRIYLNLNMGKQFEEIDRILNKK